MGTAPFVVQLGPALAAEVARTRMAPEAPDGNKSVDGEEGIAEEGVGGQRENEVDDHAGAKKREEVEEGLDGSQEAEGVVHRGDGQQQN